MPRVQNLLQPPACPPRHICPRFSDRAQPGGGIVRTMGGKPRRAVFAHAVAARSVFSATGQARGFPAILAQAARLEVRRPS